MADFVYPPFPSRAYEGRMNTRMTLECEYCHKAECFTDRVTHLLEGQPRFFWECRECHNQGLIDVKDVILVDATAKNPVTFMLRNSVRIECPVCRKVEAVNEPFQLLTEPPQYSAVCQACGHKWSYSVIPPPSSMPAKPPHDAVNHPTHYTGKVECIDAIESATEGLDGIEAFCTGNAIKYAWRWKKKGGVEDLEKARWYLDRLIKKLNEDNDR